MKAGLAVASGLAGGLSAGVGVAIGIAFNLSPLATVGVSGLVCLLVLLVTEVAMKSLEKVADVQVEGPADECATCRRNIRQLGAWVWRDDGRRFDCIECRLEMGGHIQVGRSETWQTMQARGRR